jgi:hypothetical protein
LLQIAIARFVSAGVRTLHHLDADEKDEYSAGDAERRQGEAKQLEYQLPGNRNQHNDHKGQQERIASHFLLHPDVISGGETNKDGRVRNRVHDGKETHEHRRGVQQQMVNLIGHILVLPFASFIG